MGSSGDGDFKLPAVSNKVAMGGMRGLPGMPSSKGLGSRGRGSSNGNKPPLIGGGFKSIGAAGYGVSGGAGAPGLSGVNAFNVPKYGS